MARASFITASFSVMALAVVCSAALLPCSSTNTVMTCYTNQDCDWRSDTQTCAPSCAFSYPTLVDCLRDTHCEWNPYVSRCQQRCSSHPTQSDCLAPTCTWFQNATNATNGSLAFTTTLAGRNASYCGSTCGRYGDPGNCTADPNCQWDPTAQVMCVASNGTSLARDFMILELLNSELVSILIHNPSALASFALAIQRDLTEAYNGATITVNGATDVELSLILSLVTVEYASTVSTIPPVIDGQLGKPATWLKSTASLFTQLGGTTALVVGSVTPANGVAPSTTQAPPQAPFTPGPVTAPQGEASNFSTTYIVIAIVCTAVVILAAVGVLVFRWRHNPYAAARTLAVQRFTPAEFDRLKQLNEHVITYQDAVALKKQLQVPMLDRDEDSCTPELQWPVVAHASMPGKDHRNFALRPLLNEMRLELFPVVFEHLTQIRIAMDEQDRIRVNPHRVDPIDVIRYNGAFRLQIGRTSADFVLLGAARFVVVLMNDDGSCRPYDSVQVLRPDAPDSCNVVKDLFETSNYCSHVGVIDQRKVVVSRLSPPDEFAISTTIDNPTDQRDIQLLGVPASWTAVVVEAAIKVMIKVGCEHLVDGAATSWGSVYVRAEPATHAGNWRIRVYPPQSLGVLIAAAPRFWGMDNDVLCCQCTSGIGISHRVGFETMAAPVHTMAPPVPPPRGLMRHPNTPHDNQDVEMLLR